MLGKELLSYVDHTLLRPTATWDDIKEICDAGVAYKTASVCIPPDFVVINGTPAAHASIIVNPAGSSQVDGNAAISASL